MNDTFDEVCDNRKQKPLPHYKAHVNKAMTTFLNKLMLKNDDRLVNAHFRYVLNELLVNSSRGRIQKDEWALTTNIVSSLRDGQICLVANAKNGTRSLVIVASSLDNPAHDVVDGLKRDLIRLEPKPCRKQDGSSKIRVCRTKNDNGKMKGIKLCTTKRGWHAINMKVLGSDFYAVRMSNGEFRLRPEDEPELNKIYYKHVHGMTKPPSSDLPRDPLDDGIEQYLLGKYPTDAWKKSVLSRVKPKKIKETKKRNRSTHDDEDDEGEDDEDDSIIPRTVFMPGYDENMRKGDSATSSDTSDKQEEDEEEEGQSSNDYALDMVLALAERLEEEDTFDENERVKRRKHDREESDNHVNKMIFGE